MSTCSATYQIILIYSFLGVNNAEVQHPITITEHLYHLCFIVKVKVVSSLLLVHVSVVFKFKTYVGVKVLTLLREQWR